MTWLGVLHADKLGMLGIETLTPSQRSQSRYSGGRNSPEAQAPDSDEVTYADYLPSLTIDHQAIDGAAGRQFSNPPQSREQPGEPLSQPNE